MWITIQESVIRFKNEKLTNGLIVLDEKSSCETFTCQNGGSCLVIRGKALCRCTDEWAGIHCDDYRGPSSVCRGQCLHGGVCISTSALSSPRCECLDTWSGPRCEIKASCKYYCFNGGTCSLNPDEDLKPTCMYVKTSLLRLKSST